jgi:Cu2+-containing amine oxidase
LKNELLTNREFYYTLNSQNKKCYEIVEMQRIMMQRQVKKQTYYEEKVRKKDLQCSQLTEMYSMDQKSILDEIQQLKNNEIVQIAQIEKLKSKH